LEQQEMAATNKALLNSFEDAEFEEEVKEKIPELF
jgi:hypothetical protein